MSEVDKFLESIAAKNYNRWAKTDAVVYAACSNWNEYMKNEGGQKFAKEVILASMEELVKEIQPMMKDYLKEKLLIGGTLEERISLAWDKNIDKNSFSHIGTWEKTIADFPAFAVIMREIIKDVVKSYVRPNIIINNENS